MLHKSFQLVNAKSIYSMPEIADKRSIQNADRLKSMLCNFQNYKKATLDNKIAHKMAEKNKKSRTFI